MNTKYDSYTTQMTFRDAASQSNALQDAEMMALQARAERGLTALFSGSRKAFTNHTLNMTAIWYKEEEASLEMILTSRAMAVREQLNHWLQQGGLFLRRQTAEVAIEERQTLEKQVIQYMSSMYARACELKVEADTYAEVPAIQQRFHRLIEQLLDESDAFVNQLMHDFKDMLGSKL